MKQKSYKNLFLFLIISLSVFLSLNFTSGAFSVNLINISLNETGSFQYNFSTSAGSDTNITNFNVTLPADIVFNDGTNFTDGTNGQVKHLFNSTTTVLSWVNSSVNDDGTPYYLLNGTEVMYFNFTAIASIPGNFTINVTIMNASQTYQYNLTILINDTTAPHNVSFDGATHAGATNQSQNWIYVNVTANDSEGSYAGALANVTFQLSHSNGTVLDRTLVTANKEAINFTSLSDGVYYINATSNDTLGHINATGTGTRAITVDATAPHTVNFTGATHAGATNQSQNWIFVNVSVNDSTPVFAGSLANISYSIYYSNGTLFNRTVTSGNGYNNPSVINFTGLSDGVYHINATANDTAGNSNTTGTGTRAITVDATAPFNVSFDGATHAEATNQSQNWIFVNVSVNDTQGAFTGSLANITYQLMHSNGTVLNRTITGGSNGSNSDVINFTGLSDGVYYINATANDTLGNINATGTGTRAITVDGTAPHNVSFDGATPTGATNQSQNWIFVNVSVNDASAVFAGSLANVTYQLMHSNGTVLNRTITGGSNGQNSDVINFTGLSDGVYYINATANDTAGNINATGTGTRAITVDATAPHNVSFDGATPANNSNLTSQTWIFVNVSVNDSSAIFAGSLANISYSIHYSNGTLFNRTVANGNGYNNPSVINFTGLPDAVFHINATANDSAGNSNGTRQGTRVITIDNAAPSATASCTSSSLTEGDTQTCTCSASDATSGVQTQTANSNPSTTSTGTFTYTCAVTDWAGNSASSNFEYTINGAGNSGGGGGSGGGSGGTTGGDTTTTGGDTTTTTDGGSDDGLRRSPDTTTSTSGSGSDSIGIASYFTEGKKAVVTWIIVALIIIGVIVAVIYFKKENATAYKGKK